MKNRKLTLLVLLALLVRVEVVYPQASVTTAELRGQITDQSGAAIAGATITLTDVGKGTSRTATSDEDGSYVLLSLPPSTYTMKVEASGFAAKTLTNLTLEVGQTANVPVQLGVGSVSAEVNITGGSEVIEAERTQQSSVINERFIDNLPINRRNYLDFALLTPGVTDSDTINDSSDFRVAQTPQTGLSFGGNNGRGNSILVDGASADTNSGGARTIVGQEAVQEFQVNRNSYNAEFGGASGGIVNIVSKTGTNDLHGSIFGYFRDETFDARNAFDFNPDGKSSFDRQQYGGSLGGRIIRDKMFFFTSLERLTEDRTTFVNLINNPAMFQLPAAQNTFLNVLAGNPSFAALAAGLRPALVGLSSNPSTIALFEDASGQFPFEENSTVFSARIDHTFDDTDSGYIRFNLSDMEFENNAAGALTAVSRGRTFSVFTGGLLLSETHFFSPTTINEVKAQYSYLDNDVIPNDLIGPEFNIAGFGNFGRDIFLPSEAIERRYEISDNLSLVRGNHTLKFGGLSQSVDTSANSQTFFGGRFNFGALPLISFLVPAAVQTPLRNFLLSSPSTAPLAGITINSIQAFNAGLPSIYQQGFGESGSNYWTYRNSLYVQDTWKVRPNLTFNLGLRYYIEHLYNFAPTDTNNFQPRIGFSWDPWSDGKTIIRAGYGIFTGQVDGQIVNVVNELAGRGDPTEITIVLSTANPALSAAVGLPTSFAIFQSLRARGILGTRTITAADLAAVTPAIVPRPGGPLEVRFRVEPNFENPYTQQASLAIQRELGADFNVEVSYLFARGAHLTRNRDINPFKMTGPPSAITGQPTFNRFPNPALGLTSDFRNPLRAQDNVYESSANSFYHAGTIQLIKRFSRYYSINANYTLSKTIDEVTDFNSDWSAQNPLNLRLDRALSSFHQKHRFVFAGVFQSPFDGDSTFDRVFGGWVLSPIFIAGSGRPFNLLLGGIDANADFRSSSDRPGTAGRNTGLGEPFYSVDLRLARRFFESETRYLEFTFEAFNLFNRINYTGVNNEVGATFPVNGPFNVRGIEGLPPTAPLGFTTAAPARQLQFGARFNF
jgi:outer membrane receptor protein involved in Fe transport